MTRDFRPGDAVAWIRYGTMMRGTVVEVPRGSVVIMREHGTWNRTWAHKDSLELAID